MGWRPDRRCRRRSSALRQQGPARIVVAVPVGARETCASGSAGMADEVVCLATPEPFNAVGLWYEEFSQTSDEEVQRACSARAGRRADAPWQRRPASTDADPSTLVRATRAAAHRRSVAVRRTARTASATRASCCSARPRTARTSSTASARSSRRRLITEKGFAAVAVEADWPDAYRVNRYVRGAGADEDSVEALGGLRALPDLDVAQCRRARLRRLAARSTTRRSPRMQRAGFYGLDLYSLRASMEAVLAYLDKVDPEAARRARARYACFDQFGDDMQAYGYATASGSTPSCEHEVVTQLVELHAAAPNTRSRDGRVAADEFFYAEQNARLVRNAEEYYRTMFRGRVESWNLRDRHMAETLDELLGVPRSHGGPAPRRGVGAQLASRRCARHRDGRARRAERRAAGARAVRRTRPCSSGSRPTPAR